MHSPRARAGFTLIELLTVIAIIAILMSLLLPVLGPSKKGAKRASARQDLTQFVNAVEAFKNDYGVYPIVVTGSADQEYGSQDGRAAGPNSNLVNVLRADSTDGSSATNPNFNNAVNTRRVPYLDVPFVRDLANPQSGLGTGAEQNAYKVTVPGEWYDPWGAPYIICVDANYDGYTDAGVLGIYTDLTYAKDPSGNKALQTGCIGGSFGADHMPGAAGNNVHGGSDDVLSWQ
jgi:prepilin-type N-terminal cleavage/methylation domain-containing protein